MTDNYVHLPALLADTFGISRSEARRALNQGGVGLDGRQILDFDLPRDMVEGKELRLGRRRSAVVTLANEAA